MSRSTSVYQWTPEAAGQGRAGLSTITDAAHSVAATQEQHVPVCEHCTLNVGCVAAL